MADITFDHFEVMEAWEEINAVGGETVSSRKGKYMRIDSTTGKAVLGNGTTSGEVGVLRGLARSNQKYLGDAVTLLRYGIVDIGDELDSLNYGDSVYISDTDGTFGTASGDSTTSSVGGYVYPVADDNGTIHKKLLVDLR